MALLKNRAQVETQTRLRETALTSPLPTVTYFKTQSHGPDRAGCNWRDPVGFNMHFKFGRQAGPVRSQWAPRRTVRGYRNAQCSNSEVPSPPTGSGTMRQEREELHSSTFVHHFTSICM